MNIFFICLIKLYQKIPLKSHFSCRFYPTCSEYAIISIQKYGILRAFPKIVKRILSCNPWHKHEVDLP